MDKYSTVDSVDSEVAIIDVGSPSCEQYRVANKTPSVETKKRGLDSPVVQSESKVSTNKPAKSTLMYTQCTLIAEDISIVPRPIPSFLVLHAEKYYVSIVPRPIPSVSMLHAEKCFSVCSVEKLGMGLGTRLSWYLLQGRKYSVHQTFVGEIFTAASPKLLPTIVHE